MHEEIVVPSRDNEVSDSGAFWGGLLGVAVWVLGYVLTILTIRVLGG